jgi:polygalacturonase
MARGAISERAEFSRRFVTLGLGAALAASPSLVRASGSLRGFHDVRDYGAVGDGIAIDSGAINRAIEAASAQAAARWSSRRATTCASRSV